MDKDKLKELMLHIASMNAEDPNFGKTRLFKELFWADAFHYGLYGRTITGSDYIKYPQGPIPAKGMKAFRDLVTEGDATLQMVGTPTGERHVLIPQRKPDTTIFDESEIAQVEYVTKSLKWRTAREVSDHSHEVGPWKYAGDMEKINLNAIFIDDSRQPSDKDRALAYQELERRGALVQHSQNAAV